MKVKVSEVIARKGLDPFTVQFENGELEDGVENRLQCRTFMTKNNKHFMEAYLNEMIYSDEIFTEDLQQTFLVVRNTKSDKVRLIGLKHVSLTPRLKRKSFVPDEPLPSEKITNAELNKKFGSKRTKRNTEQKERLKLDINNVKEQLEQTVADIEIVDDVLDGTQPKEQVSTYLPPINRDASTIENIYNLEELIPTSVMESLNTELDNILLSDKIEDLGLFNFCGRGILLLKENITSETGRLKSKLFVYVNLLMKFVATPAKNISKKFVLCQTSTEVNNHILNNFSVQSGLNRLRPMSMRDKSICYILVLGALASNYRIDLDILAKDLKTGIKKLQEMTRILGFSTTGSTAVLKLPLPLPVSIVKRRKR